MSAGERSHSRFSLPPFLAPARRTITHPSPAVPLTADDVLLSLSAKKKVKVQRTQDYLKNRVLLRSYTQATAQASYDYNLRTEKASAGRQTQQVYITAAVVTEMRTLVKQSCCIGARVLLLQRINQIKPACTSRRSSQACMACIYHAGPVVVSCSDRQCVRRQCLPCSGAASCMHVSAMPSSGSQTIKMCGSPPACVRR